MPAISSIFSYQFVEAFAAIEGLPTGSSSASHGGPGGIGPSWSLGRRALGPGPASGEKAGFKWTWD